jgi:peptidoglycan/xylan/chitin deacetylase (PgdA/CDA1 family)
MLNFKNTNIVFVLAVLLLAGIHLLYGLSVWAYVALAFIYSLVVFYGCYFVDSNFFFPVICSAKTARKEIAITFDDGPAVNCTPEILKVLRDFRVHGAFFCIGNRIAGNEELLKEVDRQGHIIGNHSFSHHFWFDLFPAEKVKKDLASMDDALLKVIGRKPRLFRPPYGVTNPNLKKAVFAGRYTAVGWNIRSLDTVISDEQKLLNRVIRGLKPGGIILFHDTSRTTLNILASLIRHVKANGYEIVRLDKLLNLEPYA